MLYAQMLREAIDSRPHDYIINVDETFWTTIMSNGSTFVVRTGKSIHTDVFCQVRGNLKEGFTAMAGITYSGKKLPLYMLAKGTTKRCHGQLIKTKPENKIYHSASGWFKGPVMMEYLIWFRRTMEQSYDVGPRARLLLIVDVYTSHREEGLYKLA
jgi:hypothetical protein